MSQGYTVSRIHSLIAKLNEDPKFTEDDLDLIREVLYDHLERSKRNLKRQPPSDCLPVARARWEAGLSITEAAQLSGYSVASISGWERGKTGIRADKLERLMKIYLDLKK